MTSSKLCFSTITFNKSALFKEVRLTCNCTNTLKILCKVLLRSLKNSYCSYYSDCKNFRKVIRRKANTPLFLRKYTVSKQQREMSIIFLFHCMYCIKSNTLKGCLKYISYYALLNQDSAYMKWALYLYCFLKRKDGLKFWMLQSLESFAGNSAFGIVAADIAINLFEMQEHRICAELLNKINVNEDLGLGKHRRWYVFYLISKCKLVLGQDAFQDLRDCLYFFIEDTKFTLQKLKEKKAKKIFFDILSYVLKVFATKYHTFSSPSFELIKCLVRPIFPISQDVTRIATCYLPPANYCCNAHGNSINDCLFLLETLANRYQILLIVSILNRYYNYYKFMHPLVSALYISNSKCLLICNLIQYIITQKGELLDFRMQTNTFFISIQKLMPPDTGSMFNMKSNGNLFRHAWKNDIKELELGSEFQKTLKDFLDIYVDINTRIYPNYHNLVELLIIFDRFGSRDYMLDEDYFQISDTLKLQISDHLVLKEYNMEHYVNTPLNFQNLISLYKIWPQTEVELKKKIFLKIFNIFHTLIGLPDTEKQSPEEVWLSSTKRKEFMKMICRNFLPQKMRINK